MEPPCNRLDIAQPTRYTPSSLTRSTALSDLDAVARPDYKAARQRPQGKP